MCGSMFEWYLGDAERYTWNDAVRNIASLEHYPTIDEIFGGSAATFVQYFRLTRMAFLSQVSASYYRD